MSSARDASLSEPPAKHAFEHGDYRTARALAHATLNDSDASKQQKDDARAVILKTSPPTLAKYIFLLTAVLLLLLSAFWTGQSAQHHDDYAAPRPSGSAP